MGVVVERWMVIISHRAPMVLLSDRVYHYWSLNSTKRIDLSLHQHSPKIHSSFHSDVEFESVFHLQKMLRRRQFWEQRRKIVDVDGQDLPLHVHWRSRLCNRPHRPSVLPVMLKKKSIALSSEACVMNRRPKCIRDDDLISRLVIWAVLKIFQISWNLQNSGDSVFTKTAD